MFHKNRLPMRLLSQVSTCAIYIATNGFQLYMLCYMFMDFGMNCFTCHPDQYCWNVINTWHQGYKWDKNIKADIMVEWIFLALDTDCEHNHMFFSFTKGEKTC